MISLQERILSQMVSNPKINIHKIIKGKRAFDRAIHLFKSPEKNLDLGLYYTNTEKKNAMLIIYSQKFRVNEAFGFKLIIGEDVNGEKYKKSIDNTQFLERLKINL